MPFRMFDTFSVIFIIMFALVFGIILFSLIRSLLQWNKNNHSPRLTVNAKVVGKRIQVNRRRGGVSNHSGSYTRYFVAFEVESGDRMELVVEGNQYGLLIEGDNGKLSFQGTRFLNFQRC